MPKEGAVVTLEAKNKGLSEMNRLTHNLAAAATDYEVGEHVASILGEKTIVPLLGPFAVGKTALMRAVELQDPEFTRTKSFTTREARLGEDMNTYDFLGHDEQVLATLWDKVAAKELVQFIVHPTTEHVYGTTTESYGPGSFAMLDIVPDALPGIESLPFADMKKIQVIAEPTEWTHRALARLKDGSVDDVQKRVSEGISNLEWAFEESDLTWINNSQRPVSDTAGEFLSVISDGEMEDPAARGVGEDLWFSMRALRGQI